MKVRESGMPEEKLWNSFFNVDAILNDLEINQGLERVVEIGTGYGTFTLAVANKIKGTLYSFDIEKEMLQSTHKKCEECNIQNIVFTNTDVLKEGTGLREKSVDYVMLFNILHNEDPVSFLSGIKCLLKPSGKIGILHWRTDIETPRGPNMSIRSNPEDIIKWLNISGLSVHKQPFIIEPYHFGILAKN